MAINLRAKSNVFAPLSKIQEESQQDGSAGVKTLADLTVRPEDLGSSPRTHIKMEDKN